MTTTDPLPVRMVDTAARLEIHAAECAHRIPRTAEVSNGERTVEWLASVDAESVDLGTQRPVQPCLRKIIKAAAR